MSNEVPRSSRKNKPISEETRQRKVDLSLQGRPTEEISRMLYVNYKYVLRINNFGDPKMHAKTFGNLIFISSFLGFYVGKKF